MVERALDRAQDNEIARAYARGERFEDRITLFEWRGKQLAVAQRGAATIIPLKGNAA